MKNNIKIGSIRVKENKVVFIDEVRGRQEYKFDFPAEREYYIEKCMYYAADYLQVLYVHGVKHTLAEVGFTGPPIYPYKKRSEHRQIVALVDELTEDNPGFFKKLLNFF